MRFKRRPPDGANALPANGYYESRRAVGPTRAKRVTLCPSAVHRSIPPLKSQFRWSSRPI